MDYQEFLKTLKDADVDINPYLPFSIDSLFLYKRARRRGIDDGIVAPDSEHLAQYWTTGGACGGNCWNDADPESVRVSADPTPTSFKDFDAALEVVCPNMTFLQYKRLEATVVQTDNETHYEYYGNYKTYGYRIVMLKRLFEELQKMNLIS
jgi:hypothetical protein